MSLTIDQSKNMIEVFGEIKTRYADQRNYNNWAITDFAFDRPLDAEFYDRLKTDGMVQVKMKYENGFKVYLQGEKAEGGWAEWRVGSLPGSPKDGFFAG